MPTLFKRLLLSAHLAIWFFMAGCSLESKPSKFDATTPPEIAFVASGLQLQWASYPGAASYEVEQLTPFSNVVTTSQASYRSAVTRPGTYRFRVRADKFCHPLCGVPKITWSTDDVYAQGWSPIAVSDVSYEQLFLDSPTLSKGCEQRDSVVPAEYWGEEYREVEGRFGDGRTAYYARYVSAGTDGEFRTSDDELAYEAYSYYVTESAGRAVERRLYRIEQGTLLSGREFYVYTPDGRLASTRWNYRGDDDLWATADDKIVSGKEYFYVDGQFIGVFDGFYRFAEKRDVKSGNWVTVVVRGVGPDKVPFSGDEAIWFTETRQPTRAGETTAFAHPGLDGTFGTPDDRSFVVETLTQSSCP